MLFGESLFYSEYVTLYHDVTVFTELGIWLGSTNGEEGGFQVNHGVVHWAARLSFLFNVERQGYIASLQRFPRLLPNWLEVLVFRIRVSTSSLWSMMMSKVWAIALERLMPL